MQTQHQVIDVQLNGKPARLEGIRTISDLLASRNLKPVLVAVEHNGVIVRRDEYDTREIAPGDSLEIVHFVGGG